MGPVDDFEQANRAFELFTLAERHAALYRFANLRYDSIMDRFFEAVYSVIHEQAIERARARSGRLPGASDPPKGPER